MSTPDALAAGEETTRAIEAKAARFRRVRKVMQEEALAWDLICERFNLTRDGLENGLMWLKQYETRGIRNRRAK